MSDNLIMDALVREGVLIHVRICRPRFIKKLVPEDLGLEPEELSTRLISLGHKKLLPKEALAPFTLVESRTRQLVEESTFQFLGGIARYLPNRKLGAVQSRLDELEQQFNTARVTFLGAYANHRADALAEWEEAASRLTRHPQGLLAAVQSAFPPVEQLERKFGFDVSLFQVRAPEVLETEVVAFGNQAEIAEARNQAAREASGQIRQGVERFVTDAVATLREQTAQLCEEMLASMQSGKTGVHQKTLNRLVKFIDEFKQLNFADDRELDALLQNARRELLSHSAEEYRDDAHAQRRLADGLQALGQTAREMAEADAQELVERFGALGRRKFNLVA